MKNKPSLFINDLLEFAGQIVRFLVITGSGFAFWYLYSGLIESDYSNFERSVLNLLRLIGAFMTSILALIVTTYFDFRRQREQFERVLKENSEFLRYTIEIFQNPHFSQPLRLLISSLYFTGGSSRKVFKDFAVRRLESVAEDITNITNGNFSVEPHEEIVMTKELLKSGDWKKSVLAVNYEEEEWWNSPNGAAYLDIHKEVTSSNPRIEMIRVLLVSSRSLEFLPRVMERHKEANVKAYVLEVDEVSEELRKDFVIYDRKYVRFADTSHDGRIGRFARITNTDRIVGSYIDKFEQIMAIVAEKGIEPYEINK